MNDITTLIGVTPATNELNELTSEVIKIAEGVKSTAQQAEADNDLEKVKLLHNTLLGGSKQQRFNNKIKYGIWGAGVVLGLLLGLIIANIAGPLLEKADPLKESVFWIEVLVTLLIGGVGLFLASLITDKRR